MQHKTKVLDILDEVKRIAKKRILFLPHAVCQMSRSDRMISSSDVKEIVTGSGELIEDYPSDSRGHSCLLLGWTEEGKPIHVVCSPKSEFLAIITAYLPDSDQWDSTFKRRKKK